MSVNPYSVTELTYYLKYLLESDPGLRDLRVTGEISNLRPAASGHVYFSLKDEDASLNCAMWRSVALKLRNRMPGNGDQVVIRGKIDLYPPRGTYQLIVQDIQKAGLGDLHQRFIELRDQLKKEGLFDLQHKQALPFYPRNIGVVSSPTGAVIHDIINTLRRRFPHVRVLLSPATVQGSGAAKSIIQALDRLQADRQAEVIILARGGGSLEDLLPFNEEAVARAVFDCRIPLISAIGHETDTTITDFVADQRAPTPTAAAELAVPDVREIHTSLDNAERRLRSTLTGFIAFRRQLLDDYESSLRAQLRNQLRERHRRLDILAEQLEYNLQKGLQASRTTLDKLELEMKSALRDSLKSAQNELAMLELRMQSLSIQEVLGRGYTLTTKDGKPVKAAKTLKEGDRITTLYEKGKTDSIIEKTEEA